MDLSALALSTGVVALAEMGDKTQLLSLMLAARYPKQALAIIGAASKESDESESFKKSLVIMFATPFVRQRYLILQIRFVLKKRSKDLST